MLTRLSIRNFKRFGEASIELGDPVVLIGPNNSGKTTALQALTLWGVGLRTWLEKRGAGSDGPEERPGVPINRKDLINLPIPSALLLWNDLHVRSTTIADGKRGTQNIRIEIAVEGLSDGTPWACGLEFDYANEESIYCRPLRRDDSKNPRRMAIPDPAVAHRISYLPPMSGLADREFAKQQGEIGFLIGQGQTAQVLRNLCLNLFRDDHDTSKWGQLTEHAASLFGVELLEPQFNPVRSEITVAYREHGRELDLSCAGRGLQQTLLLLAFLYGNPKSVLLIDEPDAHLEILRQRQIFNLITDVAAVQGSQIIAASHSEVVLNEAAGRGRVIAFVGKPHVLNDRGSQVLKALTEIGFDQYYAAEQKGWVLYLENTTDLAVLSALAEILGHPAVSALQSPFLYPVATNLPQRARDHFYGLREAKGDFLGVAIFDRLEKELQRDAPLVELMWARREIENYFCAPTVLLAYAVSGIADDLFGQAERDVRLQAMEEAISEVEHALQTLGKAGPWSADIKATDDFLDPVFKKYSEKLRVPLQLRKKEYFKLASFMHREDIDPEVTEKLDVIAKVASLATPAVE